MKYRNPIALTLSALLAACATQAPPPMPEVQSPPAQERRVDMAEHAPDQGEAVELEISDELRARLGESGAALADGPDGSVRLTLPGAIAFTSGSKTVSQAAGPTLERIATALQALPGWRVLIEGHTDSVGRELFNAELSRQRAEAVLEFLVDRGIDPSKMSAVGRGEHAPIADNATAKGRAENRRIEIIVSPAAD